MKISDLKVGLFVLLGLLLAGTVIFMIGNERRAFATSVQYHAAFYDVAGLKPGAPVQLGGVRVGQVTKVAYDPETPDDLRVHVTLDIVAEEASRINPGSTAHIDPKGLLGDMMITIRRGVDEEGKPNPGRLEPGSELVGKEPESFIGALNEVGEDAKHTMHDVRKVANELSNEELHRDLRQTVHSLNVLLTQVTEGDGYPNKFLNDPEEAERISNTIDSLEQSSKELNYTLREVRLAVHQVRTGPGFAHDVLYGEGPKKEIAQIGMAAEEVGVTLRAIREGDGFAHDVLFGGETDTRDMISNFTQVSADIRDIVAGVKQGKGTVGALLVDPSVYEDLKRVIGDVERNDVLRALVRYSIKRDRREEPLSVGKKE